MSTQGSQLVLAAAGMIFDYAGSNAPDGFLFCDGSAVSRATFARLFAVIGTTFGAGDGSTTFNLPDLRGRVAAGRDNMGGTAANRLTNTGTGNPGVNGTTLGAVGGADRHTLTTAQLAAHGHTGTANSAGGHFHESGIASTTFGGSAPTASIGGAGASLLTNTAGAHTHTVTIDNAGGGEAHPNVQPTIVLNKIIKT